MFSYTRTRLSDVETLEAELRSDEDGYVINFYLHTKQIGKDGLSYTTGSRHVFQCNSRTSDHQKTENKSTTLFHYLRCSTCTDALDRRINMMIIMMIDGPGMVTD